MPSITMPRLSDSMEEGTIVRWLVPDGAEVVRGAEIVEIETDKATQTYEADADGVLRILVGEGETVAVGVAIGDLGGDGADGAGRAHGAAQAPSVAGPPP